MAKESIFELHMISIIELKGFDILFKIASAGDGN
jgi:hypothetical protein